MAFWWVLGGMAVLVGAIVLRDKSTRHKVIRAMARRWDKNVVRPQQSRKKAKARSHLRGARTSAKGLPKAHRQFERPRKPMLRPTRCTAACRTSRKPAFDRKTGRLTCDCPCGGREHGMYRKGATAAPKLPKQTVGTSGAKKPAAPVGTPKPAAPARPTAKPAAASGVTNINEGGTVGVQRGNGASGTRVTNINRGGVVGIQAGTVSGESVVMPVKKSAPPPPPKTWRGLQVESWGRMKAHADQNKRCAGGTFSAKTFRDRRTDPPKVTQEMSCDTCGKVI